MKRYDDLTEGERAQAIEKCLVAELQLIMNGGRYDDEKNGNDLQARIDAAVQKAEEMKTPWFAIEYILGDKVLKGELMVFAKTMAEKAFYMEPGELAVYLRSGREGDNE